MQWGPDVDAKLFGHVLRIHNVKLDYAALAEAMGNDCTAKAITHRVAKVRSMAEEGNTASMSNGTTSPPGAKQAPAKRTRGPGVKRQARTKNTNDGKAGKGNAGKAPKATTPGDGSDHEERIKKEDEDVPNKKRKISIFGGDAVGSIGEELAVKEDDDAAEDYA